MTVNLPETHRQVGLYDIIVSSAEAALSRQSSDGSMPPGHNGPYRIEETPARNTSHWLITFLKAYEITGNAKFADASASALSYLCGDEIRPMRASFWHFNSPYLDLCNGLVGQAWTIEALAVAAHAAGNEEPLRLAESVFLMHPFDERLGLWRRLNVEGTYASPDPTFNHQLWFAAAGSMLLPDCDERIRERVTRFLDAVPLNMALYPTGLVRHAMASGRLWPGRGIRRYARVRLARLRTALKRDPYYSKSLGYHSFNLYAFGILHGTLPGHPFWQSRTVTSMLRYVEHKEYAPGLEHNKYGYAYNPPGFEVAFALHEFADIIQRDVTADIADWVSRQLLRCYDFETHQMSRNTEDPTTHAARIYEATRLPDMPLEVIQE